MSIKVKQWKDIEIGDEFLDGSKVVDLHESYISDCYKISYESNKIFKSFSFSFELSEDHLLLCDTSHVSEDNKKFIEEMFGNYLIPTLYDKHIWFENLEKDEDGKYLPNFEDVIKSETVVVNGDKSKIAENLYWLPVKFIHDLIAIKEKVLCNNFVLKSEYIGKKEVFCVETDSHQYNTIGYNESIKEKDIHLLDHEKYGLIHHNSVSIRDVIFHCLTHGEDITIGLVDVKLTEFEPWKGHKNVAAVANNVKEAIELARLAREVMYKRNAELAKLGLNDIADFKPQKATNKVVVAGRNLTDDDKVEIKLMSGEIKTVTVKELEQYL